MQFLEKLPAVSPWPEDWDRGLTFVTWKPRAYASPAAGESLAELAGTGAGDVAVLTTAYLHDTSQSEVTVWDRRTPTHGSLRAALRRASALGLRTALKPHVDVVGGEYRGAIAPDDPRRWFQTYRDFLLPLAEIATEEGCRSFWVGTELDSMTRHLDHWERLIDEIRGVFAGPLVYCANWTDLESDETMALGRMVDRFGVDAYFPIVEEPEATVEEMIAGWGRWTPFLEEAGRLTGRPVMITELGCPSQRGAAAEPWDYARTRPLDLEVQARYYEAALSVLPAISRFCGLYFWAWSVAPTGPTDRSHSPRGKPAARVLQLSWRGMGSRATLRGAGCLQDVSKSYRGL